ncbi:MAG: BA14K family protein [Pseudomonadota bacterium]|nr:BA14K family protein [Pseudomonadota bacterium]
MRRPLFAFVLAAGCLLAAGPLAAQSWGHDSGHGQHRGGAIRAPSAFDWRGQLDRPGDYRCDAFWDASRTDCHARWRDQRHRVSPQARRDYHQLGGYRGNDGRYGRAWAHRHDGRYATRRRGYGDAYGYGRPSGVAYHGAYGRPDLVYPEGGVAGYRPAHGAARHPARIDWCRGAYRSYDARSGYYRAYSGRLIFCG